ncbi:MAG: hypothetical protein KY464_18555 [Gemmatimonadetes bacterium]|nr:hypothetical protein [Gemmatimonadota bacterium]
MARRSAENLEKVQAEIAQEKAASLGRVSSKLEEAMARLEAFDAGIRSGAGAGTRQPLVDAAGEALWYYVVQREACGFRDVESVLREFRVPQEVYLRMGMRPNAAGGSGR